MADKICFHESSQWIIEKRERAESSLVTVQQPHHHLHLAIWMSSDSVAGYCTSLNSSSLDNSRWLSQIKLQPTPRLAGDTVDSPDHLNKSNFKVQLQSWAKNVEVLVIYGNRGQAELPWTSCVSSGQIIKQLKCSTKERLKARPPDRQYLSRLYRSLTFLDITLTCYFNLQTFCDM